MNKIVIMTLVGAFIGYLTNVLAIKLLFRPIKPSKVFKIQGVIPKRHSEIALSIGEIVEEELLSVNDIIDKLKKDTDKRKVISSIKTKILDLISRKFIMFAMFESAIENMIDEIFEEEGDRLLDEISERVARKVANSISIKNMVRNKIMDLDLEHLERIIIKISKNELKHIEFLGGVLGMIIGLVQGIVIFYI